MGRQFCLSDGSRLIWLLKKASGKQKAQGGQRGQNSFSPLLPSLRFLLPFFSFKLCSLEVKKMPTQGRSGRRAFLRRILQKCDFNCHNLHICLNRPTLTTTR